MTAGGVVDREDRGNTSELLNLGDGLGRGLTRLNLLGVTGPQDQLGLVLAEAGNVGLEGLDAGVAAAVVDWDTDGESELAGDLGLLLGASATVPCPSRNLVSQLSLFSGHYIPSALPYIQATSVGSSRFPQLTSLSFHDSPSPQKSNIQSAYLTFSSSKVNPLPARTRRLYLMVGHLTTGLRRSMGLGATAAILVRRAFLRRSLRPGYISPQQKPVSFPCIDFPFFSPRKSSR